MKTHKVLKQDGVTILFTGTEAECVVFVKHCQAIGIWEITPL